MFAFTYGSYFAPRRLYARMKSGSGGADITPALGGCILRLEKEYARMDGLLVLIRVVHISAAVIAGGAAFFQVFAVRPALAVLDEPQRAALRDSIHRRWFPVVIGVIVALLVTGIANFVAYKIPLYRDHPQKGLYHALIGIKLLLALSVFHAAAVLALPGPRGDRWRNSPFWRNWLVIAIGLIVVLGAVLVNFERLFPR